MVGILSNTKKLLSYEKQGFLFHGSPMKNIKVLEPRQPSDKDNTFNNDLAVFASPSPIAPIIFACMSLDLVPNPLKVGTWSVDFDSSKNLFVAEIPLKWKEYVINNKGYVYILENKTFEKNLENKSVYDWQLKSKANVVPVSKIKVSFSDIEEIGGKIIWIC